MSAEHSQEGVTRRHILKSGAKLSARVVMGFAGIEIIGAAVNGPLFDSTTDALSDQLSLWKQKVALEEKPSSNTPPTVLEQDKQQLNVIQKADVEAVSSFVTQHPATVALHLGRRSTAVGGTLLAYTAMNPSGSPLEYLKDKFVFSKLGQLISHLPQANEKTQLEFQDQQGMVTDEVKQKELDRNLLFSRFFKEDRNHLHPILSVVRELTTIDQASKVSQMEGLMYLTDETFKTLTTNPLLLDTIRINLLYASGRKIEPNQLQKAIEERMTQSQFDFRVESTRSISPQKRSLPTLFSIFTFEEGLPIQLHITHANTSSDWVRLSMTLHSHQPAGTLTSGGSLLQSTRQIEDR